MTAMCRAAFERVSKTYHRCATTWTGLTVTRPRLICRPTTDAYLDVGTRDGPVTTDTAMPRGVTCHATDIEGPSEGLIDLQSERTSLAAYRSPAGG